ncbi:MAG TPA: hypothetical protein PK819_13320, partial [Thermomicrobiales bacterium]|nr:hypothetical protein [Thermomicrobiales bacterium]
LWDYTGRNRTGRLGVAHKPGPCTWPFMKAIAQQLHCAIPIHDSERSVRGPSPGEMRPRDGVCDQGMWTEFMIIARLPEWEEKPLGWRRAASLTIFG